MRTLLPGYPAVLGQARRRRAGPRLSRAVRRPGASARRARPPGSTCSCSTRRISSTGRAIPISARTGATGRTMRSASPRSRASAPISPRARRRASRPTSRMPTTGRPRWRRPISTTTAARGRGRSSPIHNLAFQGHYPPSIFATLGLPPRALRSTASNISAASASSRPACNSPTASPRCRRLTRARS